VVGYPIHSSFNFRRYFWIYYLAVAAFPLLTVGLFLLVVRLGFPALRSSLREPRDATEEREEDEPAPAGRARLAFAFARALVVGAVFGLEAAATFPEVARPILGVAVPVALAYCAVLGAGAWLAGRLARSRGTDVERLAIGNALAAPFAVAGLAAVAARTQIVVAVDGTVRDYTWLPAWLALAATAALLAWAVATLRRAGPARRARRLERSFLVLVAGPVSLFLLTAGLPGVAGPLDAFHEGEWLAAARLTADGAFPWRDLMAAHGLLTDVVSPLLTFALFEDSRWASIAGATVILHPLYWVSLYFLCAYLFRRHWMFLVLTQLAIVLGALHGLPHFRAVLVPPALMLLAALLRAPTWPRAAGFTFVAIVQAILTPEATPLVGALFATVLAYDVYARERGRPLAVTFRRTLRCAAAGTVALLAWFAFLATQGALDDFFFYYRTFVPDHALTGARPLLETGEAFWFAAAAPIAICVGALWYLAANLWLGRRIPVDDWVVAGGVLGLAVYYGKFLSRADVHVYHVYAIALPLGFYAAYRVFQLVEALLLRLRPLRWPSWLAPRYLTTAVALGVVLFTAPVSPVDAVRLTPHHFRATVVDHPEIERLGFATPQVVDRTFLADLSTILDAYLEPGDPLFDFSNNPAVFHYLLERAPATRYYHVSMAIRRGTQADLVEELDLARPKVVVFTSMTGMPSWDLISNQVRHYDVSAHVLERYEPLLYHRGFLIFGRKDLSHPSVAGLRARLAAPILTTELYFRNAGCDWSYAPNYFALEPDDGAAARTVSLPLGEPTRFLQITGWAADPATGSPATSVVAVLDGRVVARSTPWADRPDVAAALAHERAFPSGFSLAVPDSLAVEQVRVFAVLQSGRAMELGRPATAGSPPPSSPPLATIDLGRGRDAPVVAGSPPGAVEAEAVVDAVRVRVPEDVSLSDYGWLEVETGPRRAHAVFAVSDRLDSPQREISFIALGNGETTIRVRVAACTQWRGFRTRTLLLQFAGTNDVRGVRLLP
jgi:hypothetical protein